jgi:glutamate/tyrosine decarboxylase-like PLP-dependent enzyme
MHTYTYSTTVSTLASSGRTTSTSTRRIMTTITTIRNRTRKVMTRRRGASATYAALIYPINFHHNATVAIDLKEVKMILSSIPPSVLRNNTSSVLDSFSY